MTRDEFIYGLKACGFTVKDGQIYYEEKELIKCFDDLYFSQELDKDVPDNNVGKMDGDRAISLNSVTKMIKGLPLWSITKDVFAYGISVDDLMNGLNELPPVTPDRPTGHWIEGKVQHKINGEIRDMRACSECGCSYFVYDIENAVNETPRFCPSCGADMTGKADNIKKSGISANKVE